MTAEAVTGSEAVRNVRAVFARFADAFNAGTPEQILSETTEDFEVVLPPGYPERSFAGRENVIEHFRSLWESLDWHVEVGEVSELRPSVFLIELSGRGRGHVSGLPAVRRFWSVLELEDGLARRVREFDDRGEALASARADQGVDEDGE